MSLQIVFILAAPFSGATLFSILLNQHPAFSCDGEIFPYFRGHDEMCGCGRTQINCPYYRAVADHMLRDEGTKWDDDLFYYVPRYFKSYYLSRAFEGFWLNPVAHKIRNTLCATWPALRRKEDAFERAHLRLMRNSIDYRHASVYLDGTKSVRRIEFFIERGLSVKVIHLVRDSRAFCNSYRKNQKLRQFSKGLKVWKKSIRKRDVLQQRFPGINILDVRYHDLCHSPQAQFERICAFLGIPFDESFLQFSRQDMHVLGGRMRFKYDGRIREDKSWQSEMDTADIALIEAKTRKERQRFGMV